MATIPLENYIPAAKYAGSGDTLTYAGSLVLGGSLTVTGTFTQSGTVAFAGNVTIGDAGTDTLSLVALTTVATNQKIQFRDTGIYLQSSADGQLDIVSDTTVAVSGAVTMDSTLTLTGKLNLGLNGGAASASGLLMGVGTTANPAATAAANNMFAEFRTQSTATSGDSRGLYWRHSLAGAGLSGEAIRAFAKIEAAAATCRGAHISLDVASAGSCSGLGVGVDAQVLVHNGALTGGTYAALNVEVYSAGSSTDVSGVTNLSFIRVSNGGDATGAATVDAKAFLMTLSGFTAGVGSMFHVNTAADATHGLLIDIGGTPYAIMLTNVIPS